MRRGDQETSAGAVVFYRGDELEYLLVFSTYWGFPKGLIEPGEDEQTTALREVREETGLAINLMEGFRQVDHFWFRRGDQRVSKQAIYFLGEAHSRAARVSFEHEKLGWFTYNAALANLDFVNLRETLRKAHEYLTANR